MNTKVALNHRPLPPDLIGHAALTEPEKRGFFQLNPEALSKSEWQGLVVLAEGIIADRVPGFHKVYTREHEQAQREGSALCAALLHPNNGFTADTLNEWDKVVEKGELTKGREFIALTEPPRPLAALLKFYFHLRERVFLYHQARARERAGLIV